MYLVIDTETGGLTSETCSLLTAYFGLYDENFNYVDELDLKLKPNDNIYKVCGESMKINKINLTEHDQKAITYSQSKELILNFFIKHNTKYKRFIVVGHNVRFDVDFIICNVISKFLWNTYVDYNLLDTYNLAGFFVKTGYLPPDLKLSLDSLCYHYKIVNNYPHVAKFDAISSFELFKKFYQLTAKQPFSNYNMV